MRHADPPSRNPTDCVKRFETEDEARAQKRGCTSIGGGGGGDDDIAIRGWVLMRAKTPLKAKPSEHVSTFE
jgi:hypothetical protein